MANSPGVDVRTPPHLPSAPSNVTWSSTLANAEGGGGAQLQLNWQPPLQPNGVVIAYTVYVSADPTLAVEAWTQLDVQPGKETSNEQSTSVRIHIPSTIDP